MTTPADDSVARARQTMRAEKLLEVDWVPAAGSSATMDASRASTAPPANAVTGDKADALIALLAEHDRDCPHCSTATGHTQTVFGEGDPDARLMFVGEAPGAEEDRTGRPFVGRAGKKLEEMINAMGLAREQVYIANVLKSRPPNNRTPLTPEVEACAPYLAKQIQIIAPEVIVCLGGPSSKFMLQTTTGITRLRGQWTHVERDGFSVDIMPTFHPAYLLRNYTRETREQMWSDMQAVMEKLGIGS